MRTIFTTLLILLCTFNIVTAQDTENEVAMKVMATVITGTTIDSIPLQMDTKGELDTKELQVELSDEGSAVVLISGRPYSEIELRRPAEFKFKNQFGDSASVNDIQMLVGETDNPEEMDIAGPSLCDAYTVPESGQLIVRIGATIRSEERIRGIYTGEVDLKCRDDDFEVNG
ncbi:MAG: hypothetical protein R6V27_07565 [Balneolaceae bacterium]